MTFDRSMLSALAPKPPLLTDVILIDGAFYPTATLAAIHPGGSLAVSLSNRRDATALFRAVHRRPFPHNRHGRRAVPPAAVDPAVRAAMDPNHQTFAAYDALCALVEPILKASEEERRRERQGEVGMERETAGAERTPSERAGSGRSMAWDQVWSVFFWVGLTIWDAIRQVVDPTGKQGGRDEEGEVRMGNRWGFAPRRYWVEKVGLWVGLTILGDLQGMWMALPVWVTMVRGFVLAMVGLNVQHDANHGAVSADPAVNEALGMTQDYIGGSSLAWRFYHNTIHHVHCNDEKKDEDLRIPMLRLSWNSTRRIHHILQWLYVAALELVFGVVHIFSTMWYVLNLPREPPFSTLSPKDLWRHRWPLALAILRIAVLPCHYPFMEALMHAFVMYSVGGAYLSFFFLLSHNFEGVDKASVNSTRGCFLTHQVQTSSNVGGSWLAWWNGGLNYQIEHHLFPRVHHSYYPIIAPIVRQFCEERGIKYRHFPNVGSNVWSTLKHLWNMGHKDSP